MKYSDLKDQDILSPFSEISGEIAENLELVASHSIFHTDSKIQDFSTAQFFNQIRANK